jgi:hypothetical protein
MAGLLDIFGTGGTETLSLLGMSPAEIQRNRDDAQAQALYGLAARLFQGGNTGQSIAEGLQQGQKLYSAAMQNQLQDQLQGFQLKDLIEKRKREKQAEERQALIDKAVTGAYRPAVAAVEPPTPTGPLSGAAFGEVGTPAQEARFDLQAIAPALMATPQGRKTLSELVATQKAMAGETTSLAEGAQLIRTNPFTNKVEVVARGAEKEKPIQFQDLGNVVIGIQGGKEVMRLPKGLAPQRPEAAPSLQTVETEKGLMTFNPKTGQLSPLMIDGSPVAGKGQKPTEGEANAAGFAQRMVAAMSVTNKVNNAEQPKLGEAIYRAIPFIGDKVPEVLPEKIGGLSADRRQYLQAANNWIRANLRKESGAVIGADEWLEEYKNYFPQFNDDAKTVEQKRQFREIVTSNMIRASGKSFQAPTGDAGAVSADLYKKYNLTPR